MNQFPLHHKIFTDSAGTWEAMLVDIKDASKSIDFEQFYFTGDAVSEKFAKALIERAKNGVVVRCHFDAAGARTFSNSKIYHDMAGAGIQIKFFNWLSPFSKGFYKLAYFRNHRRLLLIDGTTTTGIAYHGGICIGDAVKKWGDLNVRLSFAKIDDPQTVPTLGSVIEPPHPLDSMQKAFEEMWTRSESPKVSWSHMDLPDFTAEFNSRMEKRRESELDQKNLQKVSSFPAFMFITQSPLPGLHRVYRLVADQISKATKSITITTPYFLPTHRIMRRLVAAKKRGVSVKVIIPQNTDHPIVDIGSKTYMNYFLENGIEIYFHPKMIHGKSVTVDGKWAMLGTMNLDNVSLKFNFESALISGDELFIQNLDNALLELENQSDQLLLKDWEKRSMSEKIAEAIVWPLRKLL